MVRRTLPFAFAAAILLAPVLPARAATSAGDDLRTRRSELLVRIADLTDHLEADQARVVLASDRRRNADAQLFQARRRVRERAVAAYVGGLHRSLASVGGPDGVYAEVLADGDEDALRDLRAARLAARAGEADAETVRDRSRRAAAELEGVRAQLEATIAHQDALDAAERAAVEAAAQARRLAMAAADAAAARVRAASSGDPIDPNRPGAYLPRHRQATAKQNEVMARWPFGPAAGVPAGLRSTGQVIDGGASWYGPGFDGRATASGAIYDQEAWTVASKELPLGTFLLVTRGQRSVLLLVNDRGPYVDGRVLDLSHAAAAYLGVGVADVHAEVLVPA